MTTMDPSDPRVQAILQSAAAGFCDYGIRKTSMDDIARGAGMSRPALYLHFKNKNAILLTLVEQHYEQAIVGVKTALQQAGSPADLLADAFLHHGGEAMEMMLSSKHGVELFDASMSVGADLIARGEAELADAYAKWIVSLSYGYAEGEAQEIGRAFSAALKGVKHVATDYQSYRTSLAHLARLLGDGISNNA